MTSAKEDAWSDFFPKTDLSESFKTRKLLEAWYLLAGENVAALVDTVKPRISKLFAFGKFGTLQQLLYDVDCYQEAGRGGVRVLLLLAPRALEAGRSCFVSLID